MLITSDLLKVENIKEPQEVITICTLRLLKNMNFIAIIILFKISTKYLFGIFIFKNDFFFTLSFNFFFIKCIMMLIYTNILHKQNSHDLFIQKI